MKLYTLGATRPVQLRGTRGDKAQTSLLTPDQRASFLDATKCRTCEGTGRVSVINAQTYAPCMMCGGTGRGS